VVAPSSRTSSSSRAISCLAERYTSDIRPVLGWLESLKGKPHVRWIRSHDEIPEHLDAIGQPPAGWKAPDLGVRLPLDLIREPNSPAAAVTLGLNLARYARWPAQKQRSAARGPPPMPTRPTGATSSRQRHQRRCKCVSRNRVGYLRPYPSRRSTPMWAVQINP
jgi:hypothetical protein